MLEREFGNVFQQIQMIWKYYDDDDDQGDRDDNIEEKVDILCCSHKTQRIHLLVYYHQNHLDHHHRHKVSRSFEFVGKRVRPFSCPTHKYFRMDDVKAKFWFKLVV